MLFGCGSDHILSLHVWQVDFMKSPLIQIPSSRPAHFRVSIDLLNDVVHFSKRHVPSTNEN